MSNFYFIIQQTFFFFIPLMIVSLGGLYSERSGISNIALEGIMIIGAFTGTVLINLFEGVIPGQWRLVVAIVFAAAAGTVYSMLHAWASIRLKAEQTISGTALNLFAPAFCVYMARNIYGSKQIAFSDVFRIAKVPLLGDIPVIGQCFFTNCYISTFIGIAVLIVLAAALNKTPFGLRLKACGENPDSAAGVGVDVVDMRYKGVALSGLLAGAGGIIFIVTTSTNFAATVSGYGFLALAVLILGQWKPGGVFLASLFFGILKAISSAYSGIPFLAELDVPSEIYKMIPYVLTLVVLAFSSGKSQAPKAVGKRHDDGNGITKRQVSNRKSKVLIGTSVAVVVIISIAITYGSTTRRGTRDVTHGYGAEIAMVIEESANIDDKSFIESEWNGIVHYSEQYGITRKYYQSQDNSDKSKTGVMDLAIKGNAKIVVVASNFFERAVYDVQDEYPAVKFILIDGTPVSEKGEYRIGDNVLCIGFAEQQAGFLAGYAAVMDGYRKLGFAGGVAVPAVVRYGYGYIAGAEYAAEKLNLKQGDVTLRYTYTGTFNATPEVLAMASSWYQNGTEIIFACGGGMNNAVMKAAEAYDCKVIGVDSDQSGESPTVITSAIKNTGGGIERVLTGLRNGEIKKGGERLVLTATENAVELPIKTSRFKQFSGQQYEEIFKALADKEIKGIPDDTTYLKASDFRTELVDLRVIK